MASPLNYHRLFKSMLLLLLVLPFRAEAHNDKTAYAIPLSGVTIDGKLDDWPQRMALYPIDWVSSAYKATPPEGPEDFTASFGVGYDSGGNLLYLAILVQDEELVVRPEAPDYSNQDLCEVYVDGDHSGGNRSGDMAVGSRTAQQYMMVPGPGKAFSGLEVDGNPALVGGNTQASGVRAASLRLGSTTVYEWAIPLFEAFPEQRLQIQPGKTIGFDVAVADADGQERGNWVAWSPKIEKVSNSALFGDLVFARDYQGVPVALGKVAPVDYSGAGAIAGQVVDRAKGTPIRGVRVEMWQEGRLVQATNTDSAGSYRQGVLAGTYVIKTSARGVREKMVQQQVEVSGGQETRVDLSLEDLGTCFYVDDDALDEGDGSAAHPFQTIQQALDATSEGDTVRVRAGTYREPVVLVSGVTLLGAGPDSTFLDGEGKRGVVEITNVEHVVLEGFAIVRGQGRPRPASGYYQLPFSGILVSASRHVRIAHNLISGNTSAYAGGGLVCYDVDSTVVIADNLIAGNSTRRSPQGGAPGGGGMFLDWRARPVVHHNTVAYNQAVGDGGGILCQGSSPLLQDNIIAFNLNGGLASRPVAYLSAQEAGPGPRLSYNDVWNNTEYDYMGLPPGEGDMAVDPEFVAPGQGDFRLSRRSPCRKAGTTGGIGADAEALQQGDQGLRPAIPPKEVREQLRRIASPGVVPVVRRVNFLSWSLPPARKPEVDTIQVQVHPLDLGLLDRSVKVYDRSSGLPSNDVTSVAPAPDGSIWVGTWGQGAARYDGLWTYLDTLTGLPGNQVLRVLPARDGTVWIATDGGLARYRDGQVQMVSRETFENLVEDQENGLWLGGAHTAHLDTVWTYLSSPDSTQIYNFLPVLVDQGGTVWLVDRYSYQPSVVLRYAPSNPQMYELPQRINPGYYPYPWKSLLQTPDSDLWVGFFEQRSDGPPGMSLGLLDTQANRLQWYRLPEEWRSWNPSLFQDTAGLLWVIGTNSLLQFDGQRWSGVQKVDFVSERAALDQDGNLWFGTADRGLVQYGPQTWTTFKGGERLEGKRVNCVAEGRDGSLWFGSEKGLSRRHRDGTWAELAIIDTLVTDLLVDRQGQVWAASARGVYRYDGYKWTSYGIKEGLPDTLMTCLAEGTDGRIWAGSRQGLFWYDGQGWKRLPVSSWRLSEWRDPNRITRLYADLKGRLWIGTEGGLYGYEQGKVKDYFEVFYSDRGVHLDSLFTLKDPEEIQQGLKAMLKEEIDMAWFLAKVMPGLLFSGAADPARSRADQAYAQLMKEDASFRALSRRTREEGDFLSRVYGYEAEMRPEWQALAVLGSEFIDAIFGDRGGSLWVSSFSLFARGDSAWVYYPSSAMPFGGTVGGATIDHRGNLWLATSQGAVCYDGEHWTTFDASDGLADNQVLDVLEDRAGNLWFATAKGVTRYRPDKRPPQTRVIRGPEETVGYGTSALTFEFEGGDWEGGEQRLTFSYALLKGDRPLQEGDWSEWTAQRFVQIPPPEDGHFSFYLRARDKALNLDPTPAVHSFYIAPPLWKVLWFQASVGLSLLLIVFSSTYAVRQRRQARQAERQLFAEMETELQTAHDLQMGLMPEEAPRIAGLEIAGRCLPANHVGGDLFQYFHTPDKLSLALADVTGHAMEAAIPVVMFCGVLRSQLELGSSLEALFDRLNRSLYATLTGHTFVCFTLGELEISTRILRLSNSGCPYPYHYRASSGEVVELRVNAYPLGIRPDTRYPVIAVQLEPGDWVVFCSDGIVEAANAAEELFGFERLAGVIREGCVAGLSATGLLERVFAEVQEFAGGVPQGDDQTGVVLKIEGEAPKG